MNPVTKRILIVVILIIAIGFILFPQLKGNQQNEEAVETPPADKRIPVLAIAVRPEPLDNKLRATGSLLADESVMLRAEVAGVVERINFTEGQRVKKGQLLVQLNDDEVRAEIQKMQHTRKLNEDIAKRQEQLRKSEAISQEELETALTTLNTTIADIKVLQVRLSKHQIRAPFDGIIGLRSVSVGSYLNPSDDIVTVYNINPIKVDFSIPGKYMSQINAGDNFTFMTDAYDEPFTGKVYAIEPQLDPRTRSLKIRGVSSNEDFRLLPGQFAQVELTLEKYENAIMIPTQAVIPELNSKKVYVYKNGLARSTEIETGIRTAENIQIVSGLSAGDTVITSGTLQLREGTAVAIELQENE